MRFTCDIPGFEDCWIEISDFWTRKDRNDFLKASEFGADEEPDEHGYRPGDYAYCDALRRKVEAVHLRTVDGDIIDDPEELTPSAFQERLDDSVATWISYTPVAAYDSRRKLGEARGRNLFTNTEQASS